MVTQGRKSMKRLLAIAGAACVLNFASVPVQAKSACDIHHLGYTKAQCDECANMTWSVSRVFPAGACVATQAPPPARIGGPERRAFTPTAKPAPMVPSEAPALP